MLARQEWRDRNFKVNIRLKLIDCNNRAKRFLLLAGGGVVVEGVLGESLSLAVCGGEMEGCKEMRIGLDKRFYLNSVCVIPSTRG